MRAYLVLVFLAAALAPPLPGPARLADLLAIGLVPALLGVYRARRSRLVLAPPERLFLCFVGWSAVVTILGIVTGTNGRGLWAALTMGRLLELVLVYAAARVYAPDRAVLGRAAALSGVALACWGCWEIFSGIVLHGEPYLRAFNEGWYRGESTHVAGALVLLALASLSAAPAGRSGLMGGWGFAASLVAVVVSGSRGALAAGLLTAVRALHLLGRRGAAVGVVAILAVAALTAPATFRNRIVHVFDRGAYSGPHVDRFEAWRIALVESPPWGVGLGARPSSVYESHYAWLYAETGAPGLVLALLGLVALVRAPAIEVREVVNSEGHRDLAHDRIGDDEDAWRIRSGIGLALLVLSIGANVFLISRVALPAALLLGAFAARVSEARASEPRLNP